MGARLRQAAEGYLGRPYDRLFLWGDEAIYCSELVWKSYREATGLELGRLSRRHGPNPPLDAPVIAPVDLFEAAGLCAVGD